MNKFYIISKNILNKLKHFTESIIRYSETLFQRKKSIDDMYVTIKQKKTKEIKSLEVHLKNIQSKKAQLEREVLIMKDSIDKKTKLIESLQDLVAKRSD